MSYFYDPYKSITSIMDQNEELFDANFQLRKSYKLIEDMAREQEKGHDQFKYVLGFIFIASFIIAGIMTLFGY